MQESVVVIGNFDGVHPGHQALLAAAHAVAPEVPLVVMTFWPHPVSVVRPDRAPMLLTGLQERIDLLEQAGADEVHVIKFTPEFAGLSPSDFVERHVVPLNPRCVVVGENFRFGHRASGSPTTLRELSDGRFEVVAVPLVTVDDEETSSTLVRDALATGDVGRAAELLERLFRFVGIVRHGDHRGRKLGFPTANLPVPAQLACPADGVYAGWVTRLDGRDGQGVELPIGVEPERWPAAISVGSNPTFDGLDRRVESYVLDRTDLELYGEPIAVDFVARIRGQVRFDGVESLIAQMESDVNRCRELLATD